jgi:hypothetical protein
MVIISGSWPVTHDLSSQKVGDHCLTSRYMSPCCTAVANRGATATTATTTATNSHVDIFIMVQGN